MESGTHRVLHPSEVDSIYFQDPFSAARRFRALSRASLFCLSLRPTVTPINALLSPHTQPPPRPYTTSTQGSATNNQEIFVAVSLRTSVCLAICCSRGLGTDTVADSHSLPHSIITRLCNLSRHTPRQRRVAPPCFCRHLGTLAGRAVVLLLLLLLLLLLVVGTVGSHLFFASIVFSHHPYKHEHHSHRKPSSNNYHLCFGCIMAPAISTPASSQS